MPVTFANSCATVGDGRRSPDSILHMAERVNPTLRPNAAAVVSLSLIQAANTFMLPKIYEGIRSVNR